MPTSILENSVSYPNSYKGIAKVEDLIFSVAIIIGTNSVEGFINLINE
jgi:malate/lactate dehydrogenase